MFFNAFALLMMNVSCYVEEEFVCRLFCLWRWYSHVLRTYELSAAFSVVTLEVEPNNWSEGMLKENGVWIELSMFVDEDFIGFIVFSNCVLLEDKVERQDFSNRIPVDHFSLVNSPWEPSLSILDIEVEVFLLFAVERMIFVSSYVEGFSRTCSCKLFVDEFWKDEFGHRREFCIGREFVVEEGFGCDQVFVLKEERTFEEFINKVRLLASKWKCMLLFIRSSNLSVRRPYIFNNSYVAWFLGLIGWVQQWIWRGLRICLRRKRSLLWVEFGFHVKEHFQIFSMKTLINRA